MAENRVSLPLVFPCGVVKTCTRSQLQQGLGVKQLFASHSNQIWVAPLVLAFGQSILTLEKFAISR